MDESKPIYQQFFFYGGINQWMDCGLVDQFNFFLEGFG